MYASDVSGALEAYRRALTIHERLAAADPKRRRDVSVALNGIGRALRATGELALVRQYYDRSLAIMRRLAEERPEDTVIQRDLSVVYNRVAGLLAEVGDYEAALAYYEEAVEIREDLLEDEPDSGRAKRDLAVEHYYIGKVHLALDQPQAALEHANQFLVAAEERTAANPTDARADRDLAIAHEIKQGSFCKQFILHGHKHLNLSRITLAGATTHEMLVPALITLSLDQHDVQATSVYCLLSCRGAFFFHLLEFIFSD